MESTETAPGEPQSPRHRSAAWARLARWAGSDGVCAAVPVLAGAWFYGTRWLGTFPLIEYRNWLAYPFSRGTLPELLGNLAARDIPFSRDVSLFTVQLTAAGCGLGYGCLNGVPIAFLLLSDLLLYFLIRRLVGSRLLASGAALLWIFSRPVMDAASWQATNHDKVAVLFTLLALNVALYFLDRPATPRRVLAGNLALGVLVVLAYNSKEAAWALVPCMLLLGFAATGGLTLGTWARSQLPLFVLPVLYAVHQNLRYFEHFQEDLPWKVHVTTGPPIRNLKIFLGLLANQSTFSVAALLPFVGIVGAALIAALWLRRHATDDAEVARLSKLMAWAGLAWALSVALVLRLLYPSPYHMVVPSAYLYVLGAAALALLAGHRPSGWRRAVVGALSVGVAGSLLVHAVTTYPEYQALEQRSAHFKERLSVFAKTVPVAGHEPIYLVTDDSRYDAYMYVGAADARDIYQYIYRDRAPNPAFEERYRDMRRSEYDALPRRAPDAYYVVFDSDMKLVEIDHGPEALYRQP
jgi:hypothetical protein